MSGSEADISYAEESVREEKGRKKGSGKGAAKKGKGKAKSRGTPDNDVIDTSTTAQAHIRQMVTVPARISLLPIVHIPPASTPNLKFTRVHIGGTPQGMFNEGGFGNEEGVGNPHFNRNTRHLCLWPSYNIVPREPGEPLLVFSSDEKLKRIIRVAQQAPAHGGPAKSVNIFIRHATNDWRYRGAYAVQEVNPTAPLEADRFLGATTPDDLRAIGSDPVRRKRLGM
ncbi:hypothetical protein RQP46_008895 [Phenoliferia psychrophenolica]